MSTTKSEYPKVLPRSHSNTFSFPVENTFFAEFLITLGAQNCPFLMLITRPVLPAASNKSVCRHKNAGICITSATALTGSACSSV